MNSIVRNSRAVLSLARNGKNLVNTTSRKATFVTIQQKSSNLSLLINEKPSVSKRNISLTSSSNASNIFNVQDDQDFQKRVLENSKPVIVDFYAVWCGPCKLLGPRLEKIMATYDGKADFAKVDIDQLQELAEKYRIMSVPTVIAIKKGKEVGKFIGLADEDKIKNFVLDAIEK